MINCDKSIARRNRFFSFPFLCIVMMDCTLCLRLYRMGIAAGNTDSRMLPHPQTIPCLYISILVNLNSQTSLKQGCSSSMNSILNNHAMNNNMEYSIISIVKSLNDEAPFTMRRANSLLRVRIWQINRFMQFNRQHKITNALAIANNTTSWNIKSRLTSGQLQRNRVSYYSNHPIAL